MIRRYKLTEDNVCFEIPLGNDIQTYSFTKEDNIIVEIDGVELFVVLANGSRYPTINFPQFYLENNFIEQVDL